jgi:hypothetical protein
MRSFFSTLITAVLLIAGNGCLSQTTKTNTPDSITGTWKGTSLCQVKNSPCHDETAVYHISKTSALNIYAVQLNKIVNGEEEEMGEENFVWDPSKQTLKGITKNRRGREAVWTFVIKDKHISGTLVMEGNILYRKIEMNKQ